MTTSIQGTASQRRKAAPAVLVLEEVEGLLLVDVLRQRQLNEYPMHLRVIVQARQ